MRLTPLLLATAAALTVACSAEEPVMGGSYVLKSIGGLPLPRPTLTATSDTVYADTAVVKWNLPVRGLGSVEHHLVTRGNGNSRAYETRVEWFKRDGDRWVYVHQTCGVGLPCAFIDERTAQLSNDRLRIASSLGSSGDWFFTRASSVADSIIN